MTVNSFYESLPVGVKPVLNVNSDQLWGISHTIREKLGSELDITVPDMGQMIQREFGHASNEILTQAKYLDDVNRYIADVAHTTVVAVSEPIPAEPLVLHWKTGSPDPLFMQSHINQSLAKLAKASDLWSDGVHSCKILDESIPVVTQPVNDINGNFPNDIVSICDQLSQNPGYPGCGDSFNNLFPVSQDLQNYITWVNGPTSLQSIPVAAHEPLVKIGTSFGQIQEAMDLISLVLPFAS